MSSNKIFTYAITTVICLAIMATACNKDNNDVPVPQEEDINYGMDNASFDQAFGQVESFADEAEDAGSLNQKGESPLAGGCATVLRDSVAKTITIDFGKEKCLCKDGRYRRGKIIISYTGKYRETGTVRYITLSNYYVNEHNITGTKSITNMGKDVSGLMYFNVYTNGAIYNPAENTTIKKTATHTRTWVTGSASPQISDDEYAIAGTGTLTRDNGNIYDIKITQALLVALNCSWIKAGVVQLTPQGGVARVLDYGTGSCDDQATVKVNGNKYTITLK